MSERKMFGGPYNGRTLEIAHPRSPVIVPIPRPISLVAEQDPFDPSYDTVEYVPSPKGFPTMVIEEKER